MHSKKTNFDKDTYKTQDQWRQWAASRPIEDRDHMLLGKTPNASRHVRFGEIYSAVLRNEFHYVIVDGVVCRLDDETPIPCEFTTSYEITDIDLSYDFAVRRCSQLAREKANLV